MHEFAYIYHRECAGEELGTIMQGVGASGTVTNTEPTAARRGLRVSPDMCLAPATALCVPATW